MYILKSVWKKTYKVEKYKKNRCSRDNKTQYHLHKMKLHIYTNPILVKRSTQWGWYFPVVDPWIKEMDQWRKWAMPHGSSISTERISIEANVQLENLNCVVWIAEDWVYPWSHTQRSTFLSISNYRLFRAYDVGAEN